MQLFKRLFSQPLRAVPAKLIIIVFIVALIGFADAGYLTVEHYRNAIPPCSITGGCERVLTSAYSTMFGVPVSLLGMIYYMIIAAGLFAYLDSRNLRVLRMTLLFTTLGLFASAWFVFLQVFIIKSICVYCLGSAITSTVLFMCAAGILCKYKAQQI